MLCEILFRMNTQHLRFLPFLPLEIVDVVAFGWRKSLLIFRLHPHSPQSNTSFTSAHEYVRDAETSSNTTERTSSRSTKVFVLMNVRICVTDKNKT